jgi:hypothetical protein
VKLQRRPIRFEIKSTNGNQSTEYPWNAESYFLSYQRKNDSIFPFQSLTENPFKTVLKNIVRDPLRQFVYRSHHEIFRLLIRHLTISGPTMSHISMQEWILIQNQYNWLPGHTSEERKFQKKRSKVDEIGVSCQESSRSLTTRKYVRGIN